MESTTELILEPILQEPVKRFRLLPWWIKTFCIIFMLLGAISVPGLVTGLFGARFELALYGLETNDPLSLAGLFICSQFILKGVVGFGLWNEKSWALNLALFDAWISLATCVSLMSLPPLLGRGLDIRLELVLIIPYLLRLKKIQPDWNRTSFLVS